MRTGSHLRELVSKAHSIAIVQVTEVDDSKWKDEQDSRVTLAYGTVTSRLKGRSNSSVVLAYKAGADDQPQIESGQRLVVFGFGPDEALLMAHQIRAFHFVGSEVTTEVISNEPGRQSLSVFLKRIRKMIARQ